MWDNSSERRELIGFVLRSPNRRAILQYFLHNGSGFPSDVAEETGINLPHVSRSLSELQNRDLVDLLVPEDQKKNRLYDITERGIAILDWTQTWEAVSEYHIVEESRFSFPDLLQFVQKALGETFLGISHHDGDELEIVFGNDDIAERLQRENLTEAAVSDLQTLSRIAAQDFSIVDRIRYGFFELENPAYLDGDAVWILVLHPSDSSVVSIASSAPPDMLVPSFAARCMNILE